MINKTNAPRQESSAEKSATALEDRQEVTVTISDERDIPRHHPLLASSDEWAAAASDDIGLDEVRDALSTIRGSLSEAIIDERRDR